MPSIIGILNLCFRSLEPAHLIQRVWTLWSSSHVPQCPGPCDTIHVTSLFSSISPPSLFLLPSSPFPSFTFPLLLHFPFLFHTPEDWVQGFTCSCSATLSAQFYLMNSFLKRMFIVLVFWEFYMWLLYLHYFHSISSPSNSSYVPIKVIASCLLLLRKLTHTHDIWKILLSPLVVCVCVLVSVRVCVCVCLGITF